MTYIKIGVNGKMSRQKKHQQQPGLKWTKGNTARRGMKVLRGVKDE